MKDTKDTEHTKNTKDIKNVLDIIKDESVKLLNKPSDSIDFNVSFLDLGINSVLSVDLIESINQRLGIDLGVEVIFDFKDSKTLAEYIVSHYDLAGQKDNIPNEQIGEQDFKRNNQVSEPNHYEGETAKFMREI